MRILRVTRTKKHGWVKLCKIFETPKYKACVSTNYKYVYNYATGHFIRWGKTLDDDPQTAPFPEILDIEVTTKCRGIPDKTGKYAVCPFCYKANTSNGINMSYDTFKSILNKFNNGLTQIAFGADADGCSNPDLFKMMELTRSRGITPNITLANVSDTIADKLSNLCGAVAISRYSNKDICYDSVQRLTDRGMKQVNIHMMLSEETFESALETLEDIQSDTRLTKLNAIVFLALKQTGRGINYAPLNIDLFEYIIKYCLEKNISFGMDSCSAIKFLSVIQNSEYAEYEKFVEPCESTCFSAYINVEGMFFPCSFAEHMDGIDVSQYDNFNDIWTHNKTENFRIQLLKNGRACPMYQI